MNSGVACACDIIESHVTNAQSFLFKPHQGRREVQRNHKQNLDMENVQLTVLLSVENFTRCRFDTNQCLGAYVFRTLSADSAYGFSTLTVGSLCPKILNVWFIMCGWWNVSTLSCNKIVLDCCNIQTKLLTLQLFKLFALHVWNAYLPSMT